MERFCPTCGAVVPDRSSAMPGRQRTFCSTRCQKRRSRKNKPRPRKIRPIVACLVCGGDFVKVRIDGVTCSRHCWNVSRGLARRAPLAARKCALPSCGVAFRPNRDSTRCCSEAHGKRLWHVENPGAGEWNDRRRDAYHRRRAQKAGTSSGDRPVVLADIAARDKNRCHLCGKKVSAKPYPHPLSASLDHLIPLSQDGEHVPENVRLAHLRCNVAKGNGGGNEQLLLIG